MDARQQPARPTPFSCPFLLIGEETEAQSRVTTCLLPAGLVEWGQLWIQNCALAALTQFQSILFKSSRVQRALETHALVGVTLNGMLNCTVSSISDEQNMVFAY